MPKATLYSMLSTKTGVHVAINTPWTCHNHVKTRRSDHLGGERCRSVDTRKTAEGGGKIVWLRASTPVRFYFGQTLVSISIINPQATPHLTRMARVAQGRREGLRHPRGKAAWQLGQAVWGVREGADNQSSTGPSRKLPRQWATARAWWSSVWR